MVDITATVVAEDLCDPHPSIVLTSIVSDEPDNAQGNGDGNTIDDIQHAAIGTPDFNFRLRAERAGSGDGRVYTVTYTATDACGLSTAAAATRPRSAPLSDAIIASDFDFVVWPCPVRENRSR